MWDRSWILTGVHLRLIFRELIISFGQYYRYVQYYCRFKLKLYRFIDTSFKYWVLREPNYFLNSFYNLFKNNLSPQSQIFFKILLTILQKYRHKWTITSKHPLTTVSYPKIFHISLDSAPPPRFSRKYPPPIWPRQTKLRRLSRRMA